MLLMICSLLALSSLVCLYLACQAAEQVTATKQAAGWWAFGLSAASGLLALCAVGFAVIGMVSGAVAMVNIVLLSSGTILGYLGVAFACKWFVHEFKQHCSDSVKSYLNQLANFMLFLAGVDLTITVLGGCVGALFAGSTPVVLLVSLVALGTCGFLYYKSTSEFELNIVDGLWVRVSPT